MDSDSLTTGTVSAWYSEEGWGVLVSADLTGTVFAHYSMIQDQAGWRGLEVGQRVAFTWDEGGQDGCDHRAVEVFSSGERRYVEQPLRPDDGAYSSSLTIDLGEGPAASS